jgi:5-methylcytosine-specific restriction endonuclease McrA
MAKLSAISLRILEVMKSHPQGISEGEIREILEIAAKDQANFGRRRRELNYLHVIEKRQDGPKVLYIYTGPRSEPRDTNAITGRLRGEARHAARGTCLSCGRSIEKHHIVLVIDHKIPRDWGGRTESDNLWAICEECNADKKNYFQSVDAAWMRKVMAHRSVHLRLGETLKAFNGKPVPAQIMDFVSNQDDWKKRVRELRYLGWKIDVFNRKLKNGRVSSFYKLVKARAWPDDPTGVIRRYEQERAKRNRNRRSQ